MRVDRVYWPLFFVLTLAVVATHALGAGPFRAELWGGHFYGFLPRGVFVAGCSLLAAALLIAWRWPAWLDRGLRTLADPARSKIFRSGLGGIAGAVLFLLIFWFFRESHTMLGDGHVLAANLPQGQRFHPLEPLSLLLHHWFYLLARGLFEGGARDPADVAYSTIGLSSALAGALFVPVAWGLARELSRVAGVETSDESEEDRSAIVPLAFLLILGQGYVQLFFGYVENYTFCTLVVGFYLLTALRNLRGRAPLLVPAVTLVIALALHLSAVALAPSFAVLAAVGLARPARRRAAVRDLALAAFAFALMNLGLSRLESGYNFAGALLGVLRTLSRGTAGPGQDYPLLSGLHLSDFLNEQLLIGPVALALYLTAAGAALVTRTWRELRVLFACAAGFGYLVACWIAGDSNLGYARNWDLLAPAGLVLSAAGLGIALHAAWRPASLRRWLFLLLCLSLFHTVPWVAVNASFDRSLARFETLPLRLGRTESAVGYWYMTHGDTTQAIAWFQRSLDENPANNIAAYSLGRIAVHRGRYRLAVDAFRAAVQSRPGLDAYRLSLVDAIVRGGGEVASAKPHVDTLLMANPQEPVYWAAYGVVCLGMGLRDSASIAFQRARRLAPQSEVLQALEARARAEGYLRAVQEDWPKLVDQ
jgi:tetratricopeptide (TPR) repeat protein